MIYGDVAFSAKFIPLGNFVIVDVLVYFEFDIWSHFSFYVVEAHFRRLKLGI